MAFWPVGSQEPWLLKRDQSNWEERENGRVSLPGRRLDKTERGWGCDYLTLFRPAFFDFRRTCKKQKTTTKKKRGLSGGWHQRWRWVSPFSGAWTVTVQQEQGWLPPPPSLSTPLHSKEIRRACPYMVEDTGWEARESATKKTGCTGGGVRTETRVGPADDSNLSTVALVRFCPVTHKNLR